MESCWPAIIVSFGVTAHRRPKRGVGAAGIDSVAEFRGLFDNVSFDGPRFETLVPSPRQRGPGRDDSLFLTSPPAPKCAFSRHDLLNWFLLWQQRPSPGIIITTDIHSVGERTFKRFQTEF
jgi:hypothetical protein